MHDVKNRLHKTTRTIDAEERAAALEKAALEAAEAAGKAVVGHAVTKLLGSIQNQKSIRRKPKSTSPGRSPSTGPIVPDELDQLHGPTTKVDQVVAKVKVTRKKVTMGGTVTFPDVTPRASRSMEPIVLDE